MAFTYDPDNLDVPLNKLRFLIQDTDSTNVLLQNSEILDAAEEEKNVYRAAANLCRVLAAKFAQQPNIGDKDIQIKNDSTGKEYRLLANDLDIRADKYEDSLTNTTAGNGLNLPKYCTGTSVFKRNLHSE